MNFLFPPAISWGKTDAKQTINRLLPYIVIFCCQKESISSLTVVYYLIGDFVHNALPFALAGEAKPISGSMAIVFSLGQYLGMHKILQLASIYHPIIAAIQVLLPVPILK